MHARRMFGPGAMALALLAVAMVGLLGCGDADAPEPANDEPAEAPADALTIPPAMQAFEDDGNVAEVVIEGDDRMQFDIDEFSVEPGQMVRLTLEHVGQLPAQTMGHNVVILEQGEVVMDFAADANELGGDMDNSYTPDPVRDRVVALTDMIGGGETTVVEFQAPAEPGEYPFLCSFPGHAGSMNGVMIVAE